jgi:hypothetical protein
VAAYNMNELPELFADNRRSANELAAGEPGRRA